MIDWNRVEELRQEVGPEDFDEVVEMFLEEVDEVITRLKSDTSRDALEADLHFLKGSALNLGFQDFCALCQVGENAAAAGQANTVNLPEILSTYEKSTVVFLANARA